MKNLRTVSFGAAYIIERKTKEFLKKAGRIFYMASIFFKVKMGSQVGLCKVQIIMILEGNFIKRYKC